MGRDEREFSARRLLRFALHQSLYHTRPLFRLVPVRNQLLRRADPVLRFGGDQLQKCCTTAIATSTATAMTTVTATSKGTTA